MNRRVQTLVGSKKRTEPRPQPVHRFTHEVRVRFRDLDSMGHVNHAVYLTYLEEARVAFFERVFGSLAEAFSAGLGKGEAREPFEFVVARAEVDYRRPAGLGEVLRTRLAVTRFGTTSFDIAYEMEDAQGRPVAAARTVQVFLGADGRPRPVPAPFRAAVDKFQAP